MAASHRLPRAALVVSLAAALALLVSGQGVRFALWPYTAGLVLMLAAGGVGLVAAALSLAGLARPAVRAGRARLLLLALAVGLAASWVPFEFVRRALAAPHIHDITTDVAEPPPFVALLPLRSRAPNGAAYGGPEIAAQQRKAYPDIVPLVLSLPPGAAFARARDAAEGLGWEIAAADPAAGRLEAVATTFWFGFKDDVVVRIRPQGSGSRIDARSASRVGGSDLGANAKRLRAFLERVKNY